ncbi:hypothetical protein RDABS01_008823 [Bienertia sinuspersici]
MMGEGDFANGKEQLAEREKNSLTNGKGKIAERGDEDLANGNEHADKRGKAGMLDKQSDADFRLGDMVWIKLRGTSWWPAQIVDEKAVSADAKPHKRKSGRVLVRLYGTYMYSYIDPVTSSLEFNNVLKQNKSSQMEIFLKALKKDLSKLQSGKTNPGKAKTKDAGKKTPSKRVAKEQDELKKKSKPNSLINDDTPQTPEGIARRLKVMQDLGLTAPSGSPFVKNEEPLSAKQ